MTDAVRTVIAATSNDDGIYVKLRLGDDPGETDLMKLSQSLVALHDVFAEHNALPRELVQACAAIIYFRDECISNLNSSAEPNRAELVRAVNRLAQEAFNFLHHNGLSF